VYGWGDEFAPRGVYMANTWQGEFPWQNLLLDGYEGTSPVEAFPANGYGLHDMAGKCGSGLPTSSGRGTSRAPIYLWRRHAAPCSET